MRDAPLHPLQSRHQAQRYGRRRLSASLIALSAIVTLATSTAFAPGCFATSTSADDAAAAAGVIRPKHGLRHLNQYVGYQGELQILAGDQTRVHLLVLSESVKYVLDLSEISGLPPLVSGMTVLASGPFIDETTSILVKSMTILRAPAMQPAGQALNISSVTFLLEICGRRMRLDPAVLRASWTDGNGTPLYGKTMQQYHEQCSFQKAAFNSADNIIVGPISLPCTGTGTLGGWDANNCRTQELLGWYEAAIAAAKARGLVTAERLQRFRTRRIMILPDMPACGWAGLGSVGCGSNCMAFTLESYALRLDTLFHELGHNVGLHHSTTLGDEYGDCSCAMGGCYTYRCFNAPQSWRLGWYRTLAKVDGTTLPRAGMWIEYNLPATQASDLNHVIVRPSWVSGVGNMGLFVSYREAVGGDSGLHSQYQQRVSVHEMPNVLDPSVLSKPVLVSVLDQSGEYSSTTLNTKVMFVQRSSSGIARVAICRFNTPADCTYGATLSPDPPSPRPPSPKPPSPRPPSPKPPAQPPAPACHIAPNPRCGDGICDGWAGENCRNCAADCDGKLTGMVQWCCGGNTRTGCGADQCGGPDKCRESCPGLPSPPPHPRPPERPSPPAPPVVAARPPPPSGQPTHAPPPPGHGCASYPNPRCGDGYCDAWAGETCRNCPQDCRGDLQGWVQFCCGYKTKVGCTAAECGGPWRCRDACPD